MSPYPTVVTVTIAHPKLSHRPWTFWMTPCWKYCKARVAAITKTVTTVVIFPAQRPSSLASRTNQNTAPTIDARMLINMNPRAMFIPSVTVSRNALLDCNSLRMPFNSLRIACNHSKRISSFSACSSETASARGGAYFFSRSSMIGSILPSRRPQGGSMHTRVLLLVLAIGVSGFGSDAEAGAAKPPHKPKVSESKKQPKVESAFSTTPFDPSIKALPPHFLGNSFRALYKSAVMIAPKGEFETTSEYQARAKRSADQTYALVINPSETRYDADSGTMYATLSPTSVYVGLGGQLTAAFSIEDVVTRERKYAASNAFGASTIVTSTTSDERAILPRVGPLSTGKTFNFKVGRSEAPRLKQRLKMLIVGTLDSKQEPALGMDGTWRGQNGFHGDEATIDEPRSWSTNYYLLRMSVSDLWLFDSATGAVLARHSDSETHDEMQLSVYESPDHSGYANVSIQGNDDLGLTTGSTESGGCTFNIGYSRRVLGLTANTWVGMSDTRGPSLVVTTGDGAILFDEKLAPTREGMVTPWPPAHHAAEAMWRAAPAGTVEVRGGDPTYPSKAPLAGFRELWRWGIKRCGFPSLEIPSSP